MESTGLSSIEWEIKAPFKIESSKPRRTINVNFKSKGLDELDVMSDMIGVSFSKMASRAMQLGIQSMKDMSHPELTELMIKKGES